MYGLTGFGQKFVKTGMLRGYGYVRGGITGYTTPKVTLGPRWQAFRSALTTNDLSKILEAARRLPSVEISHPQGETWIAYHGAQIYTARSN